MSRKGGGKGTVYFREDKKVWVADLTFPDGRRRTRVRSTERLAHRALRELRDLRDAGVIDGSSSLADYLNTWLVEKVAAGRGPSTIALYSTAIRVWIVPAVGHIRLNEVTPRDVRRVTNLLDARGLAKATQAKAHSVLAMALE